MHSWISNTDVFCRLRKSSICIKLLQMPNWGGSSLLQGFELLYMGGKTVLKSSPIREEKKKALLLFYSYGTERDGRLVLSSSESAGSSFLQGLHWKRHGNINWQYCFTGEHMRS